VDEVSRKDVLSRIAAATGASRGLVGQVDRVRRSDPELFDQVAAGKVEPKRAERIVKQRKRHAERIEAAKWITTDSGIHHLDFRAAGADIVAPESVDLIVTDPPYSVEAAGLYSDLAIFAARVLRPGGWCLAYTGHVNLPDVLANMRQHLAYGWTFSIRHTGGESRFRNLRLYVGWKPIVAFYKPPLSVGWDWFPDTISGGTEKQDHTWQQAEAAAAHFIRHLSVPYSVVVDPFSGSGTVAAAAKRLGRRWVAFDVDPEAVATSRVRVAETPDAEESDGAV
jgi:DNA modification methylase